MKEVVFTSGLRKVFGSGDTEVVALAGADVQLAEGEVSAILGPSGSGKTTLLMCIGGILEPTSGLMRIGGEDVYSGGRWRIGDLRRLRREKMGFIFQAHNLIPFLTIIENVTIAAELVGAPKAEARSRSMELLDYLEVANRADKYPATLSGGERQRVAIARALVHGPRLILADEPTASLDTERGAKVIALLRKLAKERNVGVIAVTHDVRMLDGFDRIYRMKDGVINGGEG
ncbi:MAG: ABC transporter ATP-binding protein [Nitrospirae bacterium]|nr:ABC transporter ATP-binding protein [Nitrospirota bacterium]